MSPAATRDAALVMVLKGDATEPALASFPLGATYQVAAFAVPASRKKVTAATAGFVNRIRDLRCDHAAPDALTDQGNYQRPRPRLNPRFFAAFDHVRESSRLRKCSDPLILRPPVAGGLPLSCDR